MAVSLFEITLILTFWGVFSHNCYDERECEGDYIADGENVRCYGYQSCEDATIAVADGKHAMMHGMQSGLDSYISGHGSLSVSGMQGISGATIYMTPVTVNGYFGASGAEITYYDIREELRVNLYGAYAGWGVEIDCTTSFSTPAGCTVNCGGQQGCFLADVYCDDTAPCTVNCDDTTCPDIIGGSGTGLTNVEVREIKKKRMKDRKKYLDLLNNPDFDPDEYREKIWKKTPGHNNYDGNKYVYLSLSSMQMAVLVCFMLLAGILALAQIYMCMYGKNRSLNTVKYHNVKQESDIENA